MGEGNSFPRGTAICLPQNARCNFLSVSSVWAAPRRASPEAEGGPSYSQLRIPRDKAWHTLAALLAALLLFLLLFFLPPPRRPSRPSPLPPANPFSHQPSTFFAHIHRKIQSSVAPDPRHNQPSQPLASCNLVGQSKTPAAPGRVHQTTDSLPPSPLPPYIRSPVVRGTHRSFPLFLKLSNLASLQFQPRSSPPHLSTFTLAIQPFALLSHSPLQRLVDSPLF